MDAQEYIKNNVHECPKCKSENFAYQELENGEIFLACQDCEFEWIIEIK